ncbi:MAG TPA: NAD(P)H-binding protein, partial [Thermomonospora sp.]|nr:NAD(P)H-binding protein [Thermomonospora sp.]
MGKIIVFGAGGRAGRAAVAEAVRRGHEVTAVVRDPARHPDLAAAIPAGRVA